MIDGIKIFDAHLHFAGRFKPREESLIDFMDRYGIDKAAITTINQDANLNVLLNSDRNMAQKEFMDKILQKEQYNHDEVRDLIKQHPDRLTGFFWFNPRIASDEDWALLEKYVKDYKFKGIKTQCYVDMLKVPTDLFELAQFCIEKDIPLFVHSGSAFFFQKPTRAKDYFKLAKKYPDLKLIIGHAAFTMEYTISLLRFFAKNQNTPNVYFETSVSIPYGIMTLIKALGNERILYGSDAPTASPPDIEISKIMCLRLGSETLKKVFYKNMKSLIRSVD